MVHGNEKNNTQQNDEANTHKVEQKKPEPKSTFHVYEGEKQAINVW